MLQEMEGTRVYEAFHNLYCPKNLNKKLKKENFEFSFFIVKESIETIKSLP